MEIVSVSMTNNNVTDILDLRIRFVRASFLLKSTLMKARLKDIMVMLAKMIYSGNLPSSTYEKLNKIVFIKENY